MSGVRGIAKNLSALFLSHFVAVLQQIALVPLFLLQYGKAGYGEWLTLSAAVSYLGTLDFGVQTFVNQDLTVRYHNGDMQDFHVRQSTALRLLLGIVGTAAVLGLAVFFLPLSHFLRMDGSHGEPPLSLRVVQMAVYFLALQALTAIPFGYITGTFMVVGRAHVGAYWNNAKNVSLILGALVAVALRSNFAVVAGTQAAAIFLCLAGALVHLRLAAPDIFPTLRYWDGTSVGAILKPSGYFALIYSSNFLVYQVPILILQRTIGPAAVTVFSIVRTIFSMTRNLLNALTQALGPEVTNLFAKKDWPGLMRLYQYSERLIFSLIPAVNLGVLYLCPFLLTIWLRQPQLFDAHVYLLSAAISVVMSTKEHKFQFQYSTNTHIDLARFLFGSYIALGALWSLLVPRFGLSALLWCWFAVELAQLAYLVVLNARFFRHYEKLETEYLVKLTLLSAAALGSAHWVLPWSVHLGLPLQVLFATAVGSLILGICYPLFHLGEVAGKFRARLQKRFA